jgi:hypothetical protein
VVLTSLYEAAFYLFYSHLYIHQLDHTDIFIPRPKIHELVAPLSHPEFWWEIQSLDFLNYLPIFPNSDESKFKILHTYWMAQSASSSFLLS